ncbi:alpha/beta fold hydrolase [Bacillus thermotolerans]|uniref:Beta-ketoadipate enol-lactone hydrolase n=1 Tax=Bacillus thermotolerans TaxID=1221996 RepID=A0A0F5I3D5_BACTR|nr:alpha/beta fold hydrolase [Bacillus thermotolerans]KKB39988.1 Beta-ketoadipate enol-lactone hydrolase [Bacillus thermotolerans]
MDRLKQGEAAIHYDWIMSEDSLAKETIILIHGIGLDMHSWDFIIPYFYPHFNILRYDLQGHGESGTGDDLKTVDALCEDLIYLTNELNISSYHLIAQGLGGLIGIQLAAQKETRLKTLVLIGVPIHYPKKLGEQVVDQRKTMAEGKESMLSIGKAMAGKLCCPPEKKKIDILLNAYERVSPSVYFQLFSTDLGQDAVMQLRSIAVPILVMSGAEDAIYPPELFSASLNFNPNARYLSVPDAAFMIQMDQPKLTAEWVTSFIKKHLHSEGSISLLESNYQKNLTSEMYAEIRRLLSQDRITSQISKHLQVDIMNGFSVRLNGRSIVEGWGKRKAKQILMYLVIQKSATRDELCDVLWPEVELKSARNRLRVGLHHLKHLLEEHTASETILVTDRENIFLQAEVESDLSDYMEAIKAGSSIRDSEERAEHYKRLLVQKVDNPLPGLFENWFLELRDWMENEWAEMAIFLADLYEARGDEKNAAYYIEQALKYYTECKQLKERLRLLSS